MKFKPYPKYKASGVEWLGDVPEGWSVETFRRIVALIGNGTSEEQIDEDDSTKRVTRIETISKGVIDLEKVGFIRQFEGIDRFRLKTGDVLFSNINSLPMIGNCAIYDSNEELYAGMNLLRLRFTNDTNPDWAVYWLRSKMWRQTIEANAKPAINQASIPQSIILALPVAKPSLGEQSAIATFLDRETAKIDTLIAKQEKLIDLLKEKRQAVISHAVTKGLDTTVAMKPSGVDWLGDVPEHWTHRRIRFCVSLNPSKSEISHFGRDLEVSFLPMEAIGDDGKLRLDITKVISDVESGYTYFRNGDITIAKITPCYENGKGGFMDGLTNGIGFGTTELIVVRPNSQTNGLFLKWLFESTPFRKIGEGHMYGAGGQKRVPDDFVRNFAISWPPLTEQQEIVSYLDKVTAKIDTLIAKAQQAIALQKEHRTALISAAVTGKIDVRENAQNINLAP